MIVAGLLLFFESSLQEEDEWTLLLDAVEEETKDFETVEEVKLNKEQDLIIIETSIQEGNFNEAFTLDDQIVEKLQPINDELNMTYFTQSNFSNGTPFASNSFHN